MNVSNRIKCNLRAIIQNPKIVASERLSPSPTTEQNIELNNAMPARTCLIGQTFGKLKVTHDAGSRKSVAQSLCLCECGRVVKVDNRSMLQGHTKSCGCSKFTDPHRLRHGHARKDAMSKTYTCWSSMIQRATNPKSKDWIHYGGRGIGVCARWLKFDNFLADMGPKPYGLTIERKDNDVGYCPENCKWDTWSNQLKNRIRKVKGPA